MGVSSHAPVGAFLLMAVLLAQAFGGALSLEYELVGNGYPQDVHGGNSYTSMTIGNIPDAAACSTHCLGNAPPDSLRGFTMDTWGGVCMCLVGGASELHSADGRFLERFQTYRYLDTSPTSPGPAIVARRVRIEMNQAGSLKLKEVAVYEQGINIAENGAVSQSSTAVPTTLYEAEDATQSGGTSNWNTNPGFSGAGYTVMHGQNSYFEISGVDGGSGGACTITFVYAQAGSSSRQCLISMNGLQVGMVQFLRTSSWTDWQERSAEVPCVAGANTVRLMAVTGQGGPSVDLMYVSNSEMNFDVDPWWELDLEQERSIEKVTVYPVIWPSGSRLKDVTVSLLNADGDLAGSYELVGSSDALRNGWNDYFELPAGQFTIPPPPTDGPTSTISPTTDRPTSSPTSSPTTDRPTSSPTTDRPTSSPTTNGPTSSPTSSPTTDVPTSSPTTDGPTSLPTSSPTTDEPTSPPTTDGPTSSPTSSPTTDEPTSSPTTNGPTSSATPATTPAPTSTPWTINFVNIVSNFGVSSQDEVVMTYEIGKNRTFETFLRAKGCESDITDAVISVNATKIKTNINATHDLLTLSYSIDKSAIANSTIWNSTVNKIEVCQVVNLVVPATDRVQQMTISEDIREVDIDFDLSVDYTVENELGAGTIEDAAGVTNVSSYVEACKCKNPDNFTCDSEPLVPNTQLHICIKSVSTDVKVKDLRSMVVKQGSAIMDVIENSLVKISSIAGMTYVEAENGVVVSTFVPTNIFSYTAGASINITGAIDMELAESGRQLLPNNLDGDTLNANGNGQDFALKIDLQDETIVLEGEVLGEGAWMDNSGTALHGLSAWVGMTFVVSGLW